MRRRRILVVDDEPGLRQMLSWNLRDEGVQVETAADGAEAEEMLATGSCALVITDIAMPKVDGLKLLRKVRKSHPSTPVILMTGFGTVETAVQAMKDGATDFVLKPFDVDGMLVRVRELLRLPHKKRKA